MRKLLQNKSVVSGLAAVALICIAGNFVRRPRVAVTARSPVQASLVSSTDFPVRDARRIEFAFAEWRSRLPDPGLARDPFRPYQPRRVAVTQTNAAPPPVPPVFVVQAISIEPGKASAVVNRKLLVPGEQLEGYAVDQINPTEVWLSGPAGRITVPIRPVASAIETNRAGLGSLSGSTNALKPAAGGRR